MPPSSPLGALTKHELLDATLAVIDREGVDALTIRVLARELGRPPMTLYSHFGSKRELLELAFGRVVERVMIVGYRSTWQEELEHLGRHMRRELLEHPHWVSLLTRTTVPVSALSVYERLLGLLMKGGFRPEAAMFAFSSVLSHALGSVLVERMMGGSPPIPKRRLEIVKGMLEETPKAAFPRIATVSPKFDRWGFDDVFDTGLRSLIRGLGEAMRHPRPRARSGGAPRTRAR